MPMHNLQPVPSTAATIVRRLLVLLQDLRRILLQDLRRIAADDQQRTLKVIDTQAFSRLTGQISEHPCVLLRSEWESSKKW